MPMMSPGILHFSFFSYFLLLLVTFLLIFCDRTQGQDEVNEQDWLEACACKDKYTQQDDNRTLVQLGYLPAVKGSSNNRQGLQISGAVTYARDIINNCSCHFKLNLTYIDTKGDEQLSTKAIVDLICNDVAAFIGPEGPTCHTAAMVAGSKNRAMISYKCSDAEVSDKNKFPTFTRMEPPDTQVTNSVLSLLNHYNWKRFTIVCQKGAQFETIAKHLEALAEEGEGFILNDVIYEEYREDKNKIFFDILARTKDRTRIYVFLGKEKYLVKFMNQMGLEQMFVEGKYMVIYLENEVLNHHDLGFRLWEKKDTSCDDESARCGCPLPENPGPNHPILQQWKSLIVVAGSTYKYDIENSTFAKQVREYNKKPPFSFKEGLSIFGRIIETYTPIYAAHLYDSVMLYAGTLNNMIEEKRAKGEPVDVHALARDGTNITKAIIAQGRHGYRSISGYTVKIDENGDSKGSFTAYAIKPGNYTREMTFSARSFVCSHYLRQVGTFVSTSSPDNLIGIDYKISTENGGPDFVAGFVPKDKPRCGFDGEGCPKNKGSTIAATVLGILLLVACIVYVVWNRRIKVEQEIEGLLWRINLDCLQRGDRQGYGGLHSSKQSLASAMSGDSGFHGRHCQTATYRGAHVRINELKFTKKRDISREIMKEMKIMREIRHPNINSFIGAHVDSEMIMLLTDFCSKGALMDILENRDIKLDMMFVSSLVNDLVTGMHFLHYNTQLQVHGNLRSSNCLITSRWTLQITDFGLQEFRATANTDDWSNDENAYASSKLLWKAPEILRDSLAHGTPKGDVYSFGIILYEIFGRAGPYGDTIVEAEEIIEQVRETRPFGWYRPDLEALKDTDLDYKAENYILDLMKDCWQEYPENRPDFTQIRNRLKKLRQGKKTNIMDQMIERMDKYTNNLEELVTDRTRLLWEEKQKTEDLLHRMLPRSVANALCEGKAVVPKSFNGVTIYFSDIVGFTKLCSESEPLEVVNFLNELYTIFDRAIQEYDVYKVETIGDAYMVVSGLPVENPIHAAEICTLSLRLLSEVKSFRIPHRPSDSLKLRIGIHSGGVVAGVVGLAMPRYCLFGDTVNTASRMESNGEPLKIHISKECNQELTRVGGFITEERGLVPMKGKGDVLTYWLKDSTPNNPVQRKGLDEANLKPLFKLPKNLASNVGANSQEIVRRRSPRMSMASGDVRQSFRERNTPDSARNSSLQLSTNRPGSTAAANAAANSQTRNGTPPVEKDGDMFRLQLNNKFLNRPRAGNSSPRSSRKLVTIKGINWTSSQTLNIPNSPLASRKHHSDQNNSANNSPVLKRNERLRTRSFSDDRSSETLPLFNMIPSPENDEETYQLLTSESNQNNAAEKQCEKPGKSKLESAVL